MGNARRWDGVKKGSWQQGSWLRLRLANAYICNTISYVNAIFSSLFEHFLDPGHQSSELLV